MKKLISIVLLALFLLQSCVIYQKTSIPIDSAVAKGKVKLISTEGREIHFDKIEKKDSLFYGTVNSIDWHIPVSEVESIYLANKKATTIVNLITVLGSVLLIVTFLLINALSFG